MPHSRPRQVQSSLLKKLKFSRVVSIQGARQTGKSFLAREILPAHLPNCKFLTLDRSSDQTAALKRPDTFIKRYSEFSPILIDEAQKSPPLFDAIKLVVDETPRPGQFILLGSTEFSKEVKIRESLTGRLSRVRIFPFNLTESRSLPLAAPKNHAYLTPHPKLTVAQLFQYLERGGFPGIFSIREGVERRALLKDWIELVCFRDLLQFDSKLRCLPDLAYDMMTFLSQSEPESYQQLAPSKSVKTIGKHLALLSQLFSLHPLRPHPLGSGKTRFLPCDVGLIKPSEDTLLYRLRTWLLLEQLSKRSYSRDDENQLFYYRSARGGIIDLIISNSREEVTAIKILDRESVDLRDLAILKAFEKKARGQYKKVHLYALAPIQGSYREDGIQIYPWTAGA